MMLVARCWILDVKDPPESDQIRISDSFQGVSRNFKFHNVSNQRAVNLF